jgi:hypothetical protein
VDRADIITRKMSADELARGVGESRACGDETETRRMEALQLDRLVAVESGLPPSRERRDAKRTKRMRALMKPLSRMSIGAPRTSRRSLVQMTSAFFAMLVLAILLGLRRWFH